MRCPASGECHVFCKGAPEKIRELCASAPEDFASVSSQHAMQGCYVIGMAHLCIGSPSKLEVAGMERAAVETPGSLGFLGLLLFRNELKPDTLQAINKIRAGDVNTVMVTGDNPHCGHYIARACNILEKNTAIYLSKPLPDSDAVTWSNMEPSSTEREALSTAEVLRKCESSDTELAITGKAMACLTRAQALEPLLLHTRIFARVQPDQKVQVIDMFIARGFVTGMCGDGGNDCGALRAAHCGIALSDAEASVVSPFTSSTKSVQSVVDVLCEGRCALVTSFAAYKFYINYGLNWSIVKTVNFYYGVRMPIIAYITIDSVCSWLCAWAITGALPLDVLLPYRPTSSLFAPIVVLSVVVPWAVWMALMAIVLAVQGGDAGHVDFQPQLSAKVGYWELGDSWESTVFTYFQVCPLIWSGVAFSVGSKFRSSLHTNTPVLGVWLAIFALYTASLLNSPNSFTAFFHVASNPHNGFQTESPVWMRYQFPLGTLVAMAVVLDPLRAHRHRSLDNTLPPTTPPACTAHSSVSRPRAS